MLLVTPGFAVHCRVGWLRAHPAGATVAAGTRWACVPELLGLRGVTVRSAPRTVTSQTAAHSIFDQLSWDM